jgi:deoxyribonuclease V
VERSGIDGAGGSIDPPAPFEEWWPRARERLIELQDRLATATTEPWRERPRLIGGCFVCFGRGGSGPGRTGDRGWAAAVAMTGATTIAEAAVTGSAGAPYEPGLLALREGVLLREAVQLLEIRPDVLLVNATGRDHPRRAGLALQLGAALGMPTIGVTHRPLLATGPWPADAHGATGPLRVEGELVGYWVRTRSGVRPVAAHAAWRTDPATAAAIAARAATGSRTPEPIRRARRLARTRRASDSLVPG